MSAALAWVKATGNAEGTRGELAEILGTDARLEHLRYKPGYSLLARVVPADDGPPSWFALFAPEARDKVSKLRRSAKKSGIALIDTPLPAHPDVTLLSGPIGADLRLRRKVRAVGGLVDRAGAPQGEVLAYNPWKRIVQVVDSPRVDGDVLGDGEVIAKVSAASHTDAHDAVARVLADLAAQGVPVLEPVAVPIPGTHLLPYMQGGDLAQVLAGASAEGREESSALLTRTGEALALLHGADVSRVERAVGATSSLPIVDPRTRLTGARNAIVGVVPNLLDAFDRAAATVMSVLEEADPVLLHGDFSTDQVLVGDRVVLNDLDRVCVGAPGYDLGSFAAVELLADRADTIDPFMSAYVDASGSVPAGVYGWAALHVLLRSVEPVRDLQPGAVDAVAARVALAKELVGGTSSGPGRYGHTEVETTGRRSSSPLLIRTLATAEGDIEVGRGWPAADGTQLFEGRDAAGRLRAGTLRADGAVELLPFATDERLPGLTGDGELLVHRPGRRAVVRMTAGGEGADDENTTVYVKHLRGKKVAGVADTTAVAGQLARTAGFSAPEVVATTSHSLTLSAVPGVPLVQLAQREDLTAWRTAWATWVEGWPKLVRAVPEGGADGAGLAGSGGSAAGGVDVTDGVGLAMDDTLTVHDAEAEAEVVATWAGHLVDFDPLGWDDDRTGRALRRDYLAATADIRAVLVEGARRRSGDRGSSAAFMGVSHRDLHDGQILADPDTGALSLLDFDTLAYAELELDLGNLIAHIRLRYRQGVVGLRARNIALAAVDRVADRLQLDENRLRAYTRAASLRLVGVYAFRPQWRELAQSLCARLVQGGRV